jgi:hypothetical protein
MNLNVHARRRASGWGVGLGQVPFVITGFLFLFLLRTLRPREGVGNPAEIEGLSARPT